jgi:uncharacterized protein YciI
MAVWLCMFEDNEAMLAVRQQRRAEHHAFLDEHRDSILLGGALFGPADTQPGAAAWVVQGESRDCVERLIAQDPYFKSGCRTYRISEWKFARERFGKDLSTLQALAVETAP